jgi:CRP/FNR family transcriptional regulator, cyclic AMP receptor protein
MTGVSLEAVQHVPFFADWNKNEVQEITRLFNEHRFSKGETVVQEGSVGDSFFLIDSGEAGVFIGGKGRTTLKPGDYFGEIALIDEGTRMASIVASTELICHELTSRDFQSLVESNGVVGSCSSDW